MKKLVFTAILALIALTACPAKESAAAQPGAAGPKAGLESAKIVFIELGSDNCVPCRMMKPIMESVRAKYGDQVEVVFHDVWTDKGRPFGAQYGIRVIPTQIFLDKDGREYFRHEGFFPEEELVKVLRQGGLSL